MHTLLMHYLPRILKSLRSRYFRIGIALILGLFLARAGHPPALAQFIQPERVAPRLYELLPDFPRENQYLSRETGTVAVTNSLATRLLRYHLYVKSRPAPYRLDWKITLADYLGVNEPMRAEQYPGASTLQTNPMESDIAIVRRLNRQQRAALVDAMVQLLNPQAARQTQPAPAANPEPPTNPGYGPPALPQPGAADLLK